MQKVFWIFLGLLALGHSASIFADDDPTTAAPAGTTAAPGATTEAPGGTTAGPGATTAAPGETTAAPGETTAAPGETTAAPSGTTAAPGETTAAPGETTAAPGETTAAPGGTTAAPGETTAAPGETTAAPGETTAGPGETTAAPGGTTAAPGETTAAPAGTTAGPGETTDNPARPEETTAGPGGTTVEPGPCVYPSQTWGAPQLNGFNFCVESVTLSTTCIANHYYVSNSTLSGCVPADEMNPKCIDVTIKPPVCTGNSVKQMQRSATLTEYYLCEYENAEPIILTCPDKKLFANNDGWLGCFDWEDWRIASGCDTYTLPKE